MVRGLALQRGLLSHRSALRAGREAKPKPPRAWRAACVTCTQSLALLRDTGRPRGQPEAASHGGKLPGRQPRIAASYIGRPEGRAWAAPSVASRVARAALALSRGKGRPGGQPARSRIMRRYRLRGSPKPRHVAVSCLASQRVIGRPGGLAEAASSLAGRVCTMHAASRSCYALVTRSCGIRAGPRGQPEAASHGGKLPGQQPRVTASYRQAGRPSLGR